VERFNVREISTAGLIAATYAVVSYFLAPISFGIYQVRVAEALTVLPFLTRASVPGLFIGCFLANIFGGNGWMDIIFGSLLTLVAAVLTRMVYHFSRRVSGNFLAVIPVLLMLSGGVYLLSEFKLSVNFAIGLGCTMISLIAVIVSVRLEIKSPSSQGFKIWVMIIVISIVAAVLMLKTTSSTYFFIVGVLLLLATLITVFILTRLWLRGYPPNVILAPLPPVLINAFGVAIYLAPIIGTGYWFAVQMIGVGQMVACYLLGLPLLLVLQKRKLFS